MSVTTHRKDLIVDDFKVLHRFRRAWHTLHCEGIQYLGSRHVSVPTWRKESRHRYILGGLKVYPREVYFVPIRAFRRLCRYAGLEPGKTLYVLFRFSMLATFQCVSERQFKVQISLDLPTGADVHSCEVGYLIEKRRLVEKVTRHATELMGT